MELHFLHAWLVFGAAALAVAGGALGVARRRLAPMCLLLGAAAMLMAAARPQLQSRSTDVKHALVLDVSGSMESRQAEAGALADGLQLPGGHSFVRFELSDALRSPGGARGQATDYRRLADIAADESINGEVVLVTDGRGRIEDLYDALDARRLVLLRAPAPSRPDAAVLGMSAPAAVGLGGSATIRVTLRCDVDAGVDWLLLLDGAELARGTVSMRAHAPAVVERNVTLAAPGLARVKWLVELPDDRDARNDQAAVAIRVGESRRVLYCTPAGTPAEADALLQALRADAANLVELRYKLPMSRAELDGAALLVINNLAVADSGATREQLEEIAAWVRDGGSLLMAGTNGAFGPGGYRASAIEDVMPVRFRPDDAPPRRVLLLLDTSSSMGDVLPGGETRLARLKQGAARVLDSLDASDRAAVAGFRESVYGNTPFAPPAEQLAALEALNSRGSTHIATALEQSVELFGHADAGARILLITDGEDVEGAGQERYAALGAELARRGIRLDVVLTEPREVAWTGWLKATLPELRLWQAGGENFEGLLETLDRAMADGERWVMEGVFAVAGAAAPLPRLVRTAERNEPSSVTLMRASEIAPEPRAHPLLARRQLGGRAAALCTDTWGGPDMVAFFSEQAVTRELAATLAYLLESAARVNLVLNQLEAGAELVWTGAAPAPITDLQTSAGMAHAAGQGRWLLAEWPPGTELAVYQGSSLLQRIALPTLVPAELRLTGDDEAFFEAASQGGVRVFSGAGAWQPARFSRAGGRPLDLTWAPTLLAMLLLLAGFALRRR